MLYQALAVIFYNRPKLFPISLNPNPRSSVATQESSLVKLKEGKSHKNNPLPGIFVLSVTELQKDAVSEDPTNCKLLPGCIDLKYLSVLIFKSVVDCWQVYRIMGLIGCLCFTGYK